MASHMAVKRIHHARDVEEEAGGETSQLKRQRAFPTAVEDVNRLQSMDVLPHVMEPFLRKVVREEVEKTISCYVNSVPRAYLNRIHGPDTRRWRLQFNKKLPGTLFSGSKIEADDYSPVQIAMVDTLSNAIVTSGYLSSCKIDIFVLDGDFGGDEHEDWTEQEFNNSLVRERDGKRPLLTGELFVSLSEGTGCFGDIIFTDNSSWIRSRKFRLGVRVQNSAKETGIREAISGAFVVKDHRGELYKKHYPPLLCDEVWRLKKIGKDGALHKRLAEHGINSVQDFLKLLVVNQESLCSMLGSGVSNKNWDAIVQHAWECCIDNTPYSYYDVEQRVKLYFNSILQVVGVEFAGSCYQRFSELSVEHQVRVNRLKEIAYKNQNSMVEITVLPTKPAQYLLIGDASHPSASNALDIPYSCVPITKQDEQSCQVTFKRFSMPRDELPGEQCQLKENTTIQEHLPSERLFSSTNNFSTRDLFGGQMQYYETEPCSTSGWGGVTYDPLMANSSTSRMLSCLPYSPEFYHGDGLFHAPGSETNGHHASPMAGFSSRISPSKWVKLLAALKCGMLIRKRLAAKRRARTPHVSYQMYPSFPDSFYGF